MIGMTFEEKFAAVVSRQLYNYMPVAILQNCRACRLLSSRTSDHMVCQMERRDKYVMCFHDALNMLDKERVEDFFCYAYPTPGVIYEESWFESLWVNPDWLSLVMTLSMQLEDLIPNES